MYSGLPGILYNLPGQIQIGVRVVGTWPGGTPFDGINLLVMSQ